jgi:hypothetical protein
VVVTVLCCGQQDILEQWLAVDVAGWSVLGLDAGDGAVLIVGLGGVLHIGNHHGCSDEVNGPKYKTRGGTSSNMGCVGI